MPLIKYEQQIINDSDSETVKLRKALANLVEASSSEELERVKDALNGGFYSMTEEPPPELIEAIEVLIQTKNLIGE